MGLDEESLRDIRTQFTREQEQQNVHKVSVKNLEAWFGTKQALKNISLDVKEKTVTAFIGPSGCGKTTLIRCLNRMHEMTPGARAKGHVIIDGIDIYDRNIDPVIIKRRIGMVFQKPNPFPTMSIYDNVAAGLKLNGISTITTKIKKLFESCTIKAVRHNTSHSMRPVRGFSFISMLTTTINHIRSM